MFPNNFIQNSCRIFIKQKYSAPQTRKFKISGVMPTPDIIIPDMQRSRKIQL